MKQTDSIQLAVIVMLICLTSKSLAHKSKFTVPVGISKAMCFSEVLSSKGVHKITYAIMDNQGKKMNLSSEEDSIASVHFSRSLDGAKLYRSTNYTGSYNHEVFGNSFIMTFCAENFSEDTDIKFLVEIAWALEINDFGTIPLSDPNQTLTNATNELEIRARDMLPINDYVRQEESSMNRSRRLTNVIMGMTGYAICFLLIVGFIQGYLLRRRLLERKLQ